jgi:tRNA(Ile2) C34 agmatinyltransferase TiaS
MISMPQVYVFEFIRVAANGRHEYRCLACRDWFWFAVGRELDDDLQPRWSGCPSCAGWRLPMPHEEDA